MLKFEFLSREDGEVIAVFKTEVGTSFKEMVKDPLEMILALFGYYWFKAGLPNNPQEMSWQCQRFILENYPWLLIGRTT